MHCWDDNFRSKGQRGEYSPRSDGTIVRAERGTSRDVVKKLAFDAIDFAFTPTRPVAGCESPTVFVVADEFHGVADGIVLLHKARSPASQEVVAGGSTQEIVTSEAQVDKEEQDLKCEERDGI